MAHKPVGVNSSFPTSSGTSARGVDTTLHQSEFLRVVAKGAGAHVAIGTLPTATTQNYFVHSGQEATISLGKPASQRVVGITTGTETILDFPEGTGAPFSVGDAVSLTVNGQSNFDFTHKIVSSVDTSSGLSGYYSTRITVDYDSSSVTDVFNPVYAELRGSFMVAAIGDGTGTLHYQQVQVSGDA